jgi:DNA-binding NarL/FixJ family response regulator
MISRADRCQCSPVLLIVEDDTLLASQVQHLLEASGFAVAAIASSGEEALLLAGAARADLALIDFAIEGKVGGAETARALDRSFGLKTLFLAAARDALPADAFGTVEKPLRPSQLFNALQQALAKLGRS